MQAKVNALPASLVPTLFVGVCFSGRLQSATAEELRHSPPPVRIASAGEWLAVQEPRATAKAKVGVQNKWLKIKDSKGNVGYVAAWLVSES